jgi:hypothetical protein
VLDLNRPIREATEIVRRRNMSRGRKATFRVRKKKGKAMPGDTFEVCRMSQKLNLLYHSVNHHMRVPVFHSYPSRGGLPLQAARHYAHPRV